MTQIKVAVGNMGQFCYSDYILLSIETGREISEVGSLKPLLIYYNGHSRYMNAALKTTRSAKNETGNI